MQNEPIEVTLKVTDVFEKLGVPYLIAGSLASTTLYGMVRTTQDSDVVAEMRLEHLQVFVSALQDEFYIDEEMIADAIQTQGLTSRSLRSRRRMHSPVHRDDTLMCSCRLRRRLLRSQRFSAALSQRHSTLPGG